MGRKELGQHKGEKFKVEGDGGTRHGMLELELETPAVDEDKKGRHQLLEIMTAIVGFLLNEVKHDGIVGTATSTNWGKYITDNLTLYDVFQKAFLQELKAAQGESEEKKDKIKQKFDDDTKFVPRFWIPQNVKHFHPQATVGVKFEKIFDLITHITNAPTKTGCRETKQAPLPEVKETKEIAPTGGTDAVPKTHPDVITDAKAAASIFGVGW
jgi:hypothetical protein